MVVKKCNQELFHFSSIRIGKKVISPVNIWDTANYHRTTPFFAFSLQKSVHIYFQVTTLYKNTNSDTFI